MGELTIAKSAGFCFGVTRAVNMVYEAIEKENVPIYTYGPIIHNDEVVKDMEKMRSCGDPICWNVLPIGKEIIRLGDIVRRR